MPRTHPGVVRATHWITAVSMVALVVSGIAILLAHPRFYWGETGVVGMPALFELPLPFVLDGQTGWGRSLHFLAAWAIVLSGCVYVANGMRSAHFRFTDYNRWQRLAYRAVIFVLVPLMIWTGLAMSPAMVSVAPAIVEILGGHQSARTVHFITAVLIVLFAAGHVAMVSLSGFTAHVAAMITGRPRPQEQTR